MPRLMPWQWFRRKRERPPDVDEPKAEDGVVRAAPRDARLGFARDYLLASGARVRIEGDDMVEGMLPDGSTACYTTSLARARDDESVTFLAEGSSALATMLDECATRARLVALELSPARDAETLALAAVATPDASCGRCLGRESELHPCGVPSCARCPLRDQKLLFAGLEGVRTAEVIRRWDAREVELTYLVAARDRNGRRDAWERLALGEQGTRRTTLSAPTIARARPGTLRAEDAARLERAMAVARDLLAPALMATASFMRQRTEREYARRIVEVEATHRRLKSEQPERADEIDAALAREREALAEVFAVDVEARVEGVCLIATPLAEARVRARGGTLTLVVDLGRGEVLPPRCARCGAECRAGSVCAQGHVSCAGCVRASAGAPVCVVCSDRVGWRDAAHGDLSRLGTAMPPEGWRVNPWARGGRSAATARPYGAAPQGPPARAQMLAGMPGGVSRGEDALSVEGLEALPPRIWCECAAWLLEAEGYVLEDSPEGERVLCWHGRQDDTTIVACALRPPAGWPLGEEDVRQVMDPSPSLSPTRGEERRWPTVLLTTASATEAAAREAERLGVRLIARDELATLLARLAGAHRRERAEAHEEARERARAAVTTRKALLAALKAHEAALARPGKTKSAGARSAVAAAASEIAVARQAAARALLVWETLVADWEASFGERPEHDGTLRLGLEPQGFAELADRAGHLREAMAQAITGLQRTPADGELGYGEWRRAVIEELARRCEALRLRVRAIDPARWQDYTQARDLEAEAAATRSATAAERVAARADQLYAQLAPRAGVAK